MSSVSSVGNPAAALQLLSGQGAKGRAADGDSAAKEAAESATTKTAENSTGGSAPSPNVVNKKA